MAMLVITRWYISQVTQGVEPSNSSFLLLEIIANPHLNLPHLKVDKRTHHLWFKALIAMQNPKYNLFLLISTCLGVLKR